MHITSKLIVALCLCAPFAGHAQEVERFKVFGESAERTAYFEDQRQQQIAKDLESRASVLKLAQARAAAAQKARAQMPQIGSGY